MTKRTITIHIDGVGLKAALQEAANKLAMERGFACNEDDYRKLLRTEINILKFIKTVK